MNIRQLQVANDSVQDRLLLRVGTQANEELRVWFTRRFLRELWPGLAAMLAGHLAPRVVDKPAPAAAAPSFDQPFRNENPHYPLGSNPLLASEATFEATGEGSARLTLREARERSLSLNLNSELLQALCSMLRAAAEQAKWELPLDYVAHAEHNTPPASPPTPTGGSKLLH